jgi:putative ABC transport system permease protein
VSRSWRAVGAESIRVAAATRVTSGLVLLLAATVPALILGTAGLSIESQGAILRRVDEAGARIVTLVTVGGEDAVIPASTVERAAGLEGVDWVLGLGPVGDVRNRQPAGGPTPVRAYRAVGAPVRFAGTDTPGGAFISALSAERLGLAGAYSVLDPGAVPVVGWFVAQEPVTALNAFVLVPSGDPRLPLERVIVSVTDVGWVERVADMLHALAGIDASDRTTVERGAALLAAREAVRDEVVQRDRLLVVALLAVAVAVGCVVVFAGTIAARRDFGRRRALGATRTQLTMLVIGATLWPALAGSATGTIAGALYLASRLGQAPAWQFPLSIAALTVLGLVAASATPAVVAASRDPLRVLRVP